MKKRYIVLGIILVALGIGYYATPSFDSIVKQLVHKYGSEVTKTNVTLGGFDLSLKNGTGSISDFTIANPSNYKSPYLLQLKKASIKVDIKSVFTDTIIIDEINVDAPVITYDMLSLTQNNFKEVLNNVQSSASSDQSNSSQNNTTQNKPASKSSSEGKKVIIKKIVISGGEIIASENLTPGQNQVSVALPTIQLNNIGQSGQGDSIPVIISKVLTKVLNVASQTVVNSKIGDLQSIATENLNAVVDGVKDRVNLKGIFGKEL